MFFVAIMQSEIFIVTKLQRGSAWDCYGRESGFTVYDISLSEETDLYQYQEVE